jgi:hypothetical protein
MKRRVVGLIGIAVILVALALASAASAHTVWAPGLGTCVAVLHDADPTNPAHSDGFQGNDPQDVIRGGVACP